MTSDPTTSSEQDAVSSPAPQTPPSGESPAAETPAEKPAAPKRADVKIGSRKDGAPTKTVKPNLAGAAHAEHNQKAEEEMKKSLQKKRAATKVPVPSKRSLSDDLEQELEAAMSGLSMEAVVSSSNAGGELEMDAMVQATVVRVHEDNVFFSVAGSHEGVASLRQFKEPPEVGQNVEVRVAGYQPDDGLYELTLPGASLDVGDWSDLVEGGVIEVLVTGSNTGGLECTVNNIRGFIPASQIALHRVENFADYHDQKLLCRITEANEQRRNLVLSPRSVLEQQREEEREKAFASLEVGQVREGIVSNIRDFGAFVDIGGGVDGLVHISQLSWDRVNHPSEVLEVGGKVQVKIEKIDPDTGKIGLSYRSLQDHPWDTVETDYPLESTVKGVVSKIMPFGAFVKLGPGVEGLVHISEIAHHRVSQVSNIVSEGQEVEVKVLSLDKEAQRIALSIKAALPAPEPETPDTPEKEEAEEELPKPTIPKRKKPLKGGTNRPSGGEQFGLNW